MVVSVDHVMTNETSDSQRWTHFDLVFNFRDLGGHRTTDGRRVRWRRLYRSATLSLLADADLERFAELGIRTVIDLRFPEEISRFGRMADHDGVRYRNICLRHTQWDLVPFRPGEDEQRWVTDRYLQMSEEGSADIAETLALIADADAVPAVVHCMVGKDRTGIISALTLSLLGVSDDEVADEYALSTEGFVALVEWERQQYGDQAPVHKPTARETMLTYLAEMRKRYGSIPDYVRDAGLTDAQLKALADHLLEPAE
jgi:protein-tyrosine phosphatase